MTGCGKVESLLLSPASGLMETPGRWQIVGYEPDV